MRKEVGSEEFYRRTNMVCLLLLIYTIVLLIFSSKIIDQAGEDEIERSYVTGGATGNVSIAIGGEAAAAPAPEEEAVLIVQQPLTTGTIIGFFPKRLDIDVFHNGEIEEDLVVQNPLSKTLALKFDTNLKDFITIIPDEITLAPGETEKVKLKFHGDSLGTVAGFIIAQGGGIKGYIPVAIDVSSSRDAGIVKVDMPEQFKVAFSGGDIVVSVDLNGFGNDIVEVIYIVKDSDNNEVVRVSQFMTVKDSLNFDKTISLPTGLRDGVYVVSVELRYGGITVVDSEVFTIGEVKAPYLEKPAPLEKKFYMSVTIFRMIVILILGLIVLSFMLYTYESKKQKRKRL